MRRRAIWLVGVAVLIVSAVWPVLSAGQDWIYTARPGDNLWNFAQDHLTDASLWRRLQEYNELSDPAKMPPGQRIRVPIRWLKVQPVPARVAAASGEGTVTRAGGGPALPLAPGVLLYAGDRVAVSRTGSATLEFADGTELLVGPSSKLEMNALRAYGRGRGMVDTQVRMEEGRMDAEVAPTRYPSSRFEVWTPAAVSAVRGTELRSAVADNGALSRTEVLEGSAEVKAEGSSIRVDEGFGTVTRKGEQPGAPRILLPAPRLPPPSKYDRVPIRVPIAPVAGAKAYRIELSSTSSFDTLLYDGVTETIPVRGPALPDGRYAMRLRAIDDHGLEGFDAVTDIVVDARPEPPLLMQPIKESKVREKVLAFGWSAPEDAVAYRFQLAKDNDFVAPLVDLDTRSEEVRVEEPVPPGVYSWRVATKNASGETGPFSDPQDFELKPAPASPELEPPQQDQDTTIFRWRAGDPDQSYHVQLARDREFGNLRADKKVAEPQLSMPRLRPGQYFLRVRTIDDDGYEGPFSPVQVVDIPPEDRWPLMIPFLILLPALL